MNGKEDTEKTRWTLLPWAELELVVLAFQRGAEGRPRDGWQTIPDASNRYKDAMLRHCAAVMRGEWLDERGTPHLASVAANALILLWHERNAHAGRSAHG